MVRAAGLAAVAAALAATVGDFLLLYVANAARPELRLPPPPPGALVAGYYLGAVAIPLYGLGYWQVAQGMAPAGERAARAVFLLGLYGGALGGVVHGVTGLVIHAEGLLGTSGGDPLAVVARHGAYLLPLWALLGALMLAGSVVYTSAVLSGRTVYPRWMAGLSPILVVVLLGALSSTSPWLGAFLLPAAPNLAHVVFFAASTALCPSRQLSA